MPSFVAEYTSTMVRIWDTMSPRLVANFDGYPKQFPVLKTLHHMVYGTFNGKGFLVLLLFLVSEDGGNSKAWFKMDA